jgi:hypothetical protein
MYRECKKGDYDMKRLVIMILAVAVLVAVTAPVWAGGDKVHGEKGAGSTVRDSNPWI